MVIIGPWKLSEILQQESRFASILIVPPEKAMTICATINGFLLVETHMHNDRGFIIAFSGARDRSDLENWLQRVCINDWGLRMSATGRSYTQNFVKFGILLFSILLLLLCLVEKR